MEIAPLVESCLQTTAEGWKFVRWGLPQDGEYTGATQGGAGGAWPSSRPCARPSATRSTSASTSTPAWICPTRSGSAARWSSIAPFFIEDPLRSENPDSFKTLRPRTHVPLAAGEQFNSKWEFRQLIEEEWIDYARIDLCIAGGLTEAKKIAGWCETHYIKLAVHNPLGPVSSAACLHLNLSCPNFGVQEQPRKPARCPHRRLSRSSRHGRTAICWRRPRPVSASSSTARRPSRHPFRMREMPHVARR